MWNNYVLFDMIYWFDFELINDFIFGRFKKLIMIKFKSANPAQGAWKLPSLFKKAFLSRNNLNRLFMLSILVLFTYTVNATVYYVSNSGNDSNAGTSESLPWKTLTKVNSFTPKAGDQILFKRGDEWTGSITVKASGTSSSRITYGAYGTGNKPKIYGSEVITGWTLHSGNIYKTTFNTQINQLFIDDVRAKAARYPNMGYLPINTVNTTQSFTCNNLNSSINYTGAKWIARTSPYSLETFSVTSSSSKTLTLSGTPYPNLNLKTGFILVGKLEFLDSAGEWYYDSATKTVYVWTREGDSPAHHIVRGSVYNSGVAGSGYNYITIKDLELLHNKISGISSSGSYLNIDNNTISLTDAKGIYVSPGSSNTISNNTVNGANHIGIEGYSDKSTYSDNIINETSLFDEIGLSGIGAWYMGSGLYVEGNDNIIKYNRVTNSGYNGIQFHKRNVVEYNFVKNALLTKDDGGGIYTAAAGSYPNAPTAGSIIRYNIIDGVFGSLEGCNPYGVSQGHGIYLDENSGGVTVEYNTVTNISDAGIFLHNSFNETVRYNTSYNNGRQYHISTDLGGSNFNNNILYAKARNMENYAIQFLGSQLNGKVAFTENTYINHYNKSNFFKFNESKYYDFVGWKTATGQDANSTIDIAALATGETEELFYNDTKQTKTFNLGSSVYKDIYGNQVAQSVTLEPFTSKILIKTATVNTIDNTPPTITSFSIPSTSPSLVVPITTFIAVDNNGVLRYMLTESTTPPNANDAGWLANAPVSYTFTSDGTKTLYAWVKDVAGNISKSLSDDVTITLPDNNSKYLGNIMVSNLVSTTANRRAVPATFIENGMIESISIYHNGGTGNLLMGVYADQSGSPYSLLGVTTSTLISSTEGWQTVSLLSPVTVSSGQTIWLSWVFQNNPGIRYSNGTPSRAQSTESWSAGMPSSFGPSSFAEYNYSIYCTYSTGNTVIIQQDSSKPIINAFSIPTTSSSLQININSFTASDNIGVTGFLITENSTAPTADNTGWKTSAPTSYSFSTEGTKTLYAWTKDAAGNVSASKSAQVVITLPDVTKPVVSAFTVPTTSSSLIVPVSSFTATDNIAVTGYLITENSTVPTSDNTGWKTSAPTSYSFSTEGTKTLYAWTKDAAGNVSASKSAQMVIALLSNTANTQGITDVFPSVTTTQNRRAVPVTFTGDAKIESISIYHNGGTDNMLLGVYSDQSGSPASLLGVTLSTKLNTTEGWQTISLISPASVKSGQKVWLSWVFQTNPGIRYTEGAPARAQSDNLWSSGMPTDFGKSSFADYKYSVFCTYTIDSIITIQPDITKPIITSFSVPASSSSLIVPISSFNSTDNVGVTGFMLTETSSTPNANDAGWNSTAPSSYNFNSEGTKTLYAWAKDAAGNVSVGKSAQVAVVLPVEVEIPETNIPEEQLNTQSILLRKGWNIFSTYIEPINESMDSVMEMLQVNDNLSIVQDKVCNTYEKSPITQNWINNIGNLQNAEGYMIKVQSDCSLEVSGKQIQLPFNIQIKRGWNIISFPVDGSIDAMKVVQPLIDAGVLYKIQDERGYSIENWRNLGWRNSIGNFNAGEGYILQANKNGVLTINELSPKSGLNFVERSETSYFKVCYEGNGINHMNINLVELNETNLHVGDEIAAFDGEICVGAIKLTEFDLANNAVGMAVSASELNETIGFTEGNPIVLKVWTNENGQESIFQPEVIEGDMIFNKQASVFVTLNSQSTIASDMFDNLKIDMYPNPANSFVTIRFSALPAEGTKIKLLDVLGNEIRTQVVQNTQETFNIQDLPVGMYVLKTESYNNQRIQKLIKR
jgi:parallel beta-helix repeat protein